MSASGSLADAIAGCGDAVCSGLAPKSNVTFKASSNFNRAANDVPAFDLNPLSLPVRPRVNKALTCFSVNLFFATTFQIAKEHPSR
jgi:hypothetical protein